MKKKLTIKDFPVVVPWQAIESIMTKRQFKKFQKFMAGQTMTGGGFYTAGRLVATWDLERNFLWAQSQQTIEYLYDIFYGQQ